MPEAPEKAPQDGADPEVAAKLRAVLVALAFSLRDTPLPKVDRPHPGRVGDLFRPLIAIARLIAPDREAALLRVMEATAKERVAANLATSERDVLLAIWSLVKDQGLAERAKESEPGKEPQLLLGDIAARVDPDLNDEKAPKGKKAAAARRISNILRNLTLTVGRAKATNKAALVVEPSKLDPLYRRYGIASEQDVEGGA